MFIRRFEEFDKNHDLYLDVNEIIDSMKDVPALNPMIQNRTIWE